MMQITSGRIRNTFMILQITSEIKRKTFGGETEHQKREMEDEFDKTDHPGDETEDHRR